MTDGSSRGSSEDDATDAGETAFEFGVTDDSREVLSDGGDGVLLDAPDGDDDGDDGEADLSAADAGDPDRIVAERSVDEVFELFEEDSPDEVAAIEEAVETEDRAAADEAVEGLFEEMGEVSEGLQGEEPERVTAEESAKAISERARSEDGLFLPLDDRGAHRIVGESDVDGLFEHFDQDSPEEIIAAADDDDLGDEDARILPAEEKLEYADIDVTVDGEVVEPTPGDDPGELAVEDTADLEALFESTGEDSHRVVGEADPDAVFEGDPDEVLSAANPERSAYSFGEAEVEGDVDGLFEDLSDSTPDEEADADAVEAAVDAASVDPTGTDSPADDDEVEAAAEALLDDLSSVEVEGSLDGDVSGLFGDLSTVDLDPDEDVEVDDAGPQPTILEAEAAGSFQWLGEDVRILSGETDVDAVLDESPDEIAAAADPVPVPGVDAATVFDELAGQVPRGRARAEAEVPVARGWAGSSVSAEGVDAASVLGTADHEVGHLAAADPDAVFAGFEEDSPEEVAAAADEAGEPDPSTTARAVEGLVGDLSAGDRPAPQDPSAGGPAASEQPPATGSVEADGAVAGVMGDLSERDLPESDLPPRGGQQSGQPEAPTRRASPDSHPTDGTALGAFVEEPETLERTAPGAHRVAGGADVDALFRDFEEDSVAAVAAETPADERDDGVVNGVDQLFQQAADDREGESILDDAAGNDQHSTRPSLDDGPAGVPADEVETGDDGSALAGLAERLSSSGEDAAETGPATGSSPNGDSGPGVADRLRARLSALRADASERVASVRGDDGSTGEASTVDRVRARASVAARTASQKTVAAAERALSVLDR